MIHQSNCSNYTAHTYRLSIPLLNASLPANNRILLRCTQDGLVFGSDLGTEGIASTARPYSGGVFT